MAQYNPDSFRSHTPFSFVILGGQWALVKKYNLSLTNRGEASSAKLDIPLDGIDSKVFTETSNKDEHVEVKIFTGYLVDTEDPATQIKNILNLIGSNKINTQSRFRERFDGFVYQPEWSFGDERTLTLNCFDWTQILREYKFESNLQDGDTEVKNVISKIQGRLVGMKIIADSYSGSLKLGEQDGETKKFTFQSSGKTHYEILDECAKKMGKKLFVIGKNIYITTYKEEPLIWNFYYGERQSPTYKTLDGATPFKSVKLRFGQVGETQKSGCVVDLYSRTTSKKGKVSATHVRYPENAAIDALTKYVKKVLKNNLSEQELKVEAENIWKKEIRKIMTGNIDTEFANPFIDVYDVATFIGDENNPDLNYLKGTWFSINTINEEYSSDGYTQTLEIDSDPSLKNTLQERKAPNVKTVADSVKLTNVSQVIGYTPVSLGNNDILNQSLR